MYCLVLVLHNVLMRLGHTCLSQCGNSKSVTPLQPTEDYVVLGGGFPDIEAERRQRPFLPLHPFTLYMVKQRRPHQLRWPGTSCRQGLCFWLLRMQIPVQGWLLHFSYC